MREMTFFSRCESGEPLNAGQVDQGMEIVAATKYRRPKKNAARKLQF
jgi:hypothetical protein